MDIRTLCDTAKATLKEALMKHEAVVREMERLRQFDVQLATEVVGLQGEIKAYKTLLDAQEELGGREG